MRLENMGVLSNGMKKNGQFYANFGAFTFD